MTPFDRNNRPRLVCYLSEDVKSGWEALGNDLGVKASTVASQFLTAIVTGGVTPMELLTAITHSCASMRLTQHSTLPLIHKEKNKSTSKLNLEGFEDFWSAVPRKVGKGQAKKAYSAALGKTTADVLKRRATAWAAESVGKEQQFVPHPSTWLNGERWEDAGAGPPEPPSLEALGLA